MVKTNARRNRAIRRLLRVYGAGLLFFGAFGLFLPDVLLRPSDILPVSPSALADLRALYGGLPLAIGAYFVYAARDESWFAQALTMAMVATGGPALGRLYSMFASGLPNTLGVVYFGLEVLGFFWAWKVLRVITAVQPHPSSASPSDSSVSTGDAPMAHEKPL